MRHQTWGASDHVIGTVLAEAGYNSDANLNADGPDRLIATGKGPDQARTAVEEPAHGPPPVDATPREANAHRLRTPEGQDLYKRRGATVEPGIANLKKIIDSSRAAAWTTRTASCTWPPPRSTS